MSRGASGPIGPAKAPNAIVRKGLGPAYVLMLMSNQGRAARLYYMAGTFRVLSPGDHVVCAVTRQPIPLEELRYWSVERQEAYATPEAVMQRLGPALRPK